MSLFERVVRRFARDHDIVNVTLTQSGATDANEPCLLLEFGNGLTAAISHAGFETADHLMTRSWRRIRDRVRAFDTFGHQLS